jgi:hypothetical protein
MGCKAAWAMLALTLAACGGTVVNEDDTPLVAVGARRSAQADSAQNALNGPLSREVFAYNGGSRDPFESVLDQANSGPELPDLTLVATYLDLANSSRNVAVLRERITGRRYTMHEGDRVGRLEVLTIRDRAVTFRVDDFGVTRQETLSIRKSQEDNTP